VWPWDRGVHHSPSVLQEQCGTRIGKEVVDALEEAAADQEPGRPTGHDADLHKERNIVERLINRLKDWRGIATRFDKTPETYLACLHLPRLGDLNQRPAEGDRLITTSHRP
jgi:transposase